MKEQSEGYLVETENSVAAFAKAQTKENYFQAARDFVFEVMATERRAMFPVDAEQLVSQLSGKEPVGLGIVRDSNGNPFTVFLTSPQISVGTFDAAAEMIASQVFINVMQDQTLAGVAVNPWTDGGIMIGKGVLLTAMEDVRRFAEGADGEEAEINQQLAEG